jgi:hypothetical protein
LILLPGGYAQVIGMDFKLTDLLSEPGKFFHLKIGLRKGGL